MLVNIAATSCLLDTPVFLRYNTVRGLSMIDGKETER